MLILAQDVCVSIVYVIVSSNQIAESPAIEKQRTHLVNKLFQLQKMNRLVLLLAGLPACGKSTLCNRLVSELETSCSVHVQNYDEILHNEFKQFTPQAWKQTRELVQERTRQLIENHSNTDRPLVIVLDDNFYYQSMRNHFVQLCQEHTISHVQIVLKCSVDECVERDKKRKGRDHVGEEIIREMAGKFEYGKCTSNEHVIYEELESSDSIDNLVCYVLKLVDKSWSQPLRNIPLELEMEREESRRQNQESLSQRVDEMLKKKISHLLKSNLIGKEKSKDLSLIKKSVLKRVEKQNQSLLSYEEMFDSLVTELMKECL